MSDQSNTGAGSTGSEAEQAGATGGESTEAGNSLETQIKELNKQLNGQSQKTRKLEKSLSDALSKLDTVVSRLSSDSDDDDDDDDDEGEGGTQGGEAGEGEGGKPKGKQSGKTQNPEARKLLKKLERERTEAGKTLTAANNQANAWKALWVQEKTRQMIEAEVGKYDILPHAKADLIEGIERKVEAAADDDGTIEVTHKDYPSLSKFVEEYVNDRPHALRNSRAGGTGDGGGAESNAGAGSGGVKLPNMFNTWPLQKQREWVMNLTPEQRKQISKQIQW